MSYDATVGDTNHFQNEISHQNQTLSTRSKFGITALAIVGIAGIVIIGLGIASRFGPLGSTGFIASTVGGGMAAAISVGGIVWIVIANKKSRENRPTIEETARSERPLGTSVPKPIAVHTPQQNEELNSQLVADCMKLYNAEQDAWVVIPTQSDILSGKTAALGIGSGSSAYTGAGKFKIHISIDPMHMEKAIPIIIQTLYREGTPAVGLKFQTKHMLSGVHQVGKEFALIFSTEAEESESCSHTVEQLLLTLHNLFQKHGVLPENGMVLTIETREKIASLPSGIQPLEKGNLKTIKFDRKISGSNYFCYRCEDYTPIADTEDWAMQMTTKERKSSKLILFSELDQILIQSPQIIHNPLGIVDPYLNLRINL